MDCVDRYTYFPIIEIFSIFHTQGRNQMIIDQEYLHGDSVAGFQVVKDAQGVASGTGQPFRPLGIPVSLRKLPFMPP